MECARPGSLEYPSVLDNIAEPLELPVNNFIRVCSDLV